MQYFTRNRLGSVTVRMLFSARYLTTLIYIFLILILDDIRFIGAINGKEHMINYTLI
jgi:hypothetical protein